MVHMKSAARAALHSQLCILLFAIMSQPGSPANMIGVLILPHAQKATDKSKFYSLHAVAMLLLCCAIRHGIDAPVRAYSTGSHDDAHLLCLLPSAV